MASKTDLDWTSVKFVFYDTGSNAKANLYTLLKFIDQRFVYNGTKVLSSYLLSYLQSCI